MDMHVSGMASMRLSEGAPFSGLTLWNIASWPVKARAMFIPLMAIQSRYDSQSSHLNQTEE